MRVRQIGKRFLSSTSFLAAFIAGCIAPPVESPPVTVTQSTPVRVAENLKDKVDILFMIDDSYSMHPKQEELKAEFPQLISRLKGFADAKLPAWYHIGVVTSDLGAGTLDGSGCSPGGLGGKLQALGRGADAKACKIVGNDTSTGVPANYIDYNQLTGDSNLPAGQDLPTTFQCMASVGDGGCGFEHQLESVYRALHDVPKENEGFLRDDALLAVVFLTDEDDCSAPPDSDLFGSDTDTLKKYGRQDSLRCTRFGLAGGSPAMSPLPDTSGVISNIEAAPVPDQSASVGHLYTIDRYINFFKSPKSDGGVKENPDDVILVSISAPVNNQSIDIEPQLCDDQNPGQGNCQTLVHSCVSPDKVFTGDPAVRLSAVVNALNNKCDSVERSICDIDSYNDALIRLASAIKSGISPGCLNAPVKYRSENPAQPDCTVEETTVKGGDSFTTEIGWCGADACAQKMVTASAIAPCWCLVDRTGTQGCTAVQDPVTGASETNGVAICRDTTCDEKVGAALAPMATSARVECATYALKGASSTPGATGSDTCN